MVLLCLCTANIQNKHLVHLQNVIRNVFSNGNTTDGEGQVAGTCECGNEPSGLNKMRGIS
jgi:hypothetical protein